MQIDLTPKEFRRLLDMVYIGNWVLNSIRGNDRFADYDDLESKLFGLCKKWLQISIKALIGERLFTRSTYYRIMNDSDSMIGEEFRTALKTFEN